MRRIQQAAVVAACSWLAGCAAEAPPPPAPAVTHIPAAGAFGPYSAAVVSGDFCFISGKTGIAGGTFSEEARSAINALEADLARAGLSLEDVVSVTVFMTDLGRYQEFNAIYAERFGRPYPARTLVEVSRLPGAARLEIQAIARRR